MKNMIVLLIFVFNIINSFAKSLYEIKKEIVKNESSESDLSIVSIFDNKEKKILKFRIPLDINVTQFLYDDVNYYLVINSNWFLKNKKTLVRYPKYTNDEANISFDLDNSLDVNLPYLIEGSYIYEQFDDHIFLKLTEHKSVPELINNKWFRSKHKYLIFYFSQHNNVWIPINDNGEAINADAYSSIYRWQYNGILKRWYPEDALGNVEESVWFDQEPNYEDIVYFANLVSEQIEHFVSNSQNKKFDFFYECKSKVYKIKEQQRLKLEEEKRIAEEKQKLQQKIFIILGILFLVIFGGFLIKRLKKKKMKRRMKLSQIQ